MFPRIFRQACVLTSFLFAVTGALWTQQAPAQQSPPPATPRTLVWVDRAGNEQPLAAPPRPYANPRISPDGQRLAVQVEGPPSEHIWLCDLPMCTNLTQFTSEGTSNDIPVWVPDGKRIAFFSNMQGTPNNAFWRNADGDGHAERFTPISPVGQQVRSFSSDGLLAAMIHATPATGADIWVLRLSDRLEFPLLATPAIEGGPRFHPDAPWLAYMSNESGRAEVYVQEMSGDRRKAQVSTEGGREPIWNPNGRELFYRNGDRMMVVAITTKPNLSVGQPQMLFEGRYRMTPLGLTNPAYDVASDGQRFLMIRESQP